MHACCATKAARSAKRLLLTFVHLGARQRSDVPWYALCRRKPRRVECPTLVVAADGDYWLSVGLLRGMEEVVAAPEVHVVKDCSHWVQQEKCAPAYSH